MNPIRMDIEISIYVRYYINYKAKAKVICNKLTSMRAPWF